MSSKLVHAVYDDDDTLLHAVKDVKKAEQVDFFGNLKALFKL